ncbi:type I glyceraldehyde-3-phosphate dehydrogenase [Candidatus Uhrbacteria bacterium]|nr:type I glyceraldehyde-3-phosphate dehydrogenase [Candidatus Uhrbacteria bacterium]MBD3283960.1 type I glyceraldehyde-3-phosphate dehydrogenase [Candidatus Uhrbacteria bacterium]
MPRIAINGFGRIGRSTFKAGLGKPGFNVVAINDLTDTKTLAHLLTHDTMYGPSDLKISHTAKQLVVNGKKIPVYAEKHPADLPWKEHQVDVVLECTGIFRTEESASAHLDAGAKRVIISAPAKGGDVPTHVIGVNEKGAGKKSKIINNASCTTNSIAPVAAILESAFGIKKATMTTIHSYTADQRLQDAPHKDLRRARAAAMNIIPTTTGAAIATTEAITSLKGKFDGMSVRVPTAVVSLSDYTILLKKKVTVEQVNKVFKQATKNPLWKGVVEVTEEELVSSDYIGHPASAIVDLPMTKVIDGDLLKLIVWYDNEWGYSNRLAEMAIQVGKTLK